MKTSYFQMSKSAVIAFIWLIFDIVKDRDMVSLLFFTHLMCTIYLLHQFANTISYIHTSIWYVVYLRQKLGMYFLFSLQCACNVTRGFVVKKGHIIYRVENWIKYFFKCLVSFDWNLAIFIYYKNKKKSENIHRCLKMGICLFV